MWLQFMKPKAEVYERGDYQTKTRNYQSLSTPLAIFFQLIQNPVFNNRHKPQMDNIPVFDKPLQNQYLNLNMSGYSMTNNFYHKLYLKMKEMKDRQSMIMFMSDNLWICSKNDDQVTWISLDGEKMECSHDDEDARIYQEYILGQFEETDLKTCELYKTLSGISMVNARSILGDKVVSTPWLSSGYPGTSDINCIKMAKIVQLIFQIYARSWGEENVTIDSVERDTFNKFCTGFVPDASYVDKNLTLVELFELSALQMAWRAEGLSIKEEERCVDVIGQLESTGLAKLDFLGMDIAFPHDLRDRGINAVLPVLREERMLKALVFDK